MIKGFDPSLAPNATAAAVPPGKYRARIIDAVEKPARSGDGTYAQFALQICEGEHTGSVVWVRLHITSRHEHVRVLAQRELAALLRAVALPCAARWQDAVGRCLRITLGLRRRERGDVTSIVRAYAPCAARPEPT